MNIGRIFGVAVGVFAALFALTIVFGSWGTIDQGELGVKLRTGAYVDTLQPGLYFKLPLVESVVVIPTQEYTIPFEDVQSYSKDQQPAVLRVSVNVRAAPDKVGDIYARFGTLDGAVDRVVRPRVNEQTKNVFGKFNAITAIQDRTRLNQEVEDAIKQNVDPALIVTSVQIENIDFSAAYEQSIEDRMLAEVEVTKLQQNLERERVQANIKVTQAQAIADATLAQAKAEAEATKLRGDAEAQAISARATALKENASLVELTKAEKWDGKLPTTMLPGDTLPFLDVGKLTPVTE